MTTTSYSTYPDDTFDRHGNRRTTKPIGGTLGRTLAAYVSSEDAGLQREEFLRSVRSRIDLDLRDGAPSAASTMMTTTFTDADIEARLKLCEPYARSRTHEAVELAALLARIDTHQSAHQAARAATAFLAMGRQLHRMSVADCNVGLTDTDKAT